MNYIAIIPSRYGSTRLHAKALRKLCGKEMFWHVYTRTRCCPLFSEVYLATDDERIADVAKHYAIPYIMTSKEHKSGTDRVYEAARSLGVDKETVIANIQGDEPLIHPEMLTQLLSPFEKESEVNVTTLCTDLHAEDIDTPARVKVIMDKHSKALYFSRSPIPYNRTAYPFEYKVHLGLYAFRYNALEHFVSYEPCALELTESLEQLRFLYNGIPIHVVHTQHTIHSVDEEEDIAIVEQILQQEQENNIYYTPTTQM